jgi:hypothetical protein
MSSVEIVEKYQDDRTLMMVIKRRTWRVVLHFEVLRGCVERESSKGAIASLGRSLRVLCIENGWSTCEENFPGFLNVPVCPKSRLDAFEVVLQLFGGLVKMMAIVHEPVLEVAVGSPEVS